MLYRSEETSRGSYRITTHLCCARVSDWSGTSHDQDRSRVNRHIWVVDSLDVVFPPVEDCDFARKRIGVFRVLEKPFSELVRDDRRLHDGRVEQVACHVEKPCLLLHRLGICLDRPTVP